MGTPGVGQADIGQAAVQAIGVVFETAEEQVSGSSHGVQLNLLVAEGTLELNINDERVVLHAGDSILFRAELPHRYRNPHNSEAVAYLLTSPAQVQE